MQLLKIHCSHFLQSVFIMKYSISQWIALLICICSKPVFQVSVQIIEDHTDFASSDGITGSTSAQTTVSFTEQSTVPAPTPTTLSTVPAPTPTTLSTVPAPTPTTQSTVPEPTPTTKSTVPEPTPTTQSTVPEPKPTTQSTVPEPKPTTQSTVPEPTPTKICDRQPCETLLAVCIQIGQNNYTCQCPFGSYYNELSKTCIKGKSFPGEIEVKTEYKEEIQNKTSQLYFHLYENITTFFAKAFEAQDMYKETILINLRSTTKMFMDARNSPSVIADIINVFDDSSSISAEQVQEAVNNVSNGIFSNYNESNVCNVFGCDTYTTACTEENTTVVCKCKDGFSNQSPTDKSCRDCKDCSGTKQVCVHVVNETFNGPECSCEPGYKKGDKSCKQCPFGYGGTNCEDESVLIAVICGAVAAIFVIGMAGGIIGVTLRSRKNSSDAKEDSQLIPKTGKESDPAPSGFSNPVLFPKISFPRPQNVYANSSNTMSPGGAPSSYDKYDDPWLEMRKYR